FRRVSSAAPSHAFATSRHGTCPAGFPCPARCSTSTNPGMLPPDDAPLSKWWRHAAILVAIAGFAVISFVTVRAYRDAPPIPARAVTADGTVLFRDADVLRGQEVFLQYALMEHGSLWGHGAYLGPDYSATYLHRATEITRDTMAQARHGKRYADL